MEIVISVPSNSVMARHGMVWRVLAQIMYITRVFFLCFAEGHARDTSRARGEKAKKPSHEHVEGIVAGGENRLVKIWGHR